MSCVGKPLRIMVFEQHVEGDYTVDGNKLLVPNIKSFREAINLVRKLGKRLKEAGHEIALIKDYYPAGYGYVVTLKPRDPSDPPRKYNLIAVNYGDATE